MARSVPSRLRAVVWWLLIFTPLSQQQQQQTLPGRTDRAESHDTTGHEAEVAFWAQLIGRVGCREVVVLDWFAFLDPASPLRPPLHRLAIIVPIVTQPSVHTDRTLGEFFQQLAQQSLFSEPYNWLFLISPEHEPFVRATLRRLPLRADSSVYCVIYRPATPFRDDATGNLERKVLPTDRTVRRMQTIHPEVAGRTLVELWAVPPTDPDPHGSRPSNVSDHTVRTVQQLYRLQTRTQTIDVAVELAGRYSAHVSVHVIFRHFPPFPALVDTRTIDAPEGMDDAGRLVLYGPRGVELRNDFFHLATVPIMVYTGAAGYVNSTLIAGSMPLFRNASLYLFIQHADIRYDERSSKILLVVLLPCCAIGALLCLSLLLMFNLMVDRDRVHPNGRKLTLADSLIWFIGVAAQQGSSVRPNSLSTMLLILVSLLFSSILYCTYVSHITSELSVDVAAQDLLEDLLEGNQYQIGFVGNGTATLDFSVVSYETWMTSPLHV
uniref:Ionotropic glutamate receptor C-terminal domain-containing protein n=1 Tax=Anopheles atroparvus TaxID=41427 RepID=A0A182IP92_ANOAO